jgi:fructose-1-phosphate kinase PfkB-like protein
MRYHEKIDELRKLGYVTNKEAADILGYKNDGPGGAGGHISKMLEDFGIDRIEIPLGDKRKTPMWNKLEVTGLADRRAEDKKRTPQQADLHDISEHRNAKDIKIMLETLSVFSERLNDQNRRTRRLERKVEWLMSELGVKLDEANSND